MSHTQLINNVSPVLDTLVRYRKKGERMKSVIFHVPGKPQGKARARTVYNKNLSHSVSYTPENDLLYENLIKAMYITAAKGTKFDKDIPVALRIVARFEPPKSTSKKKVQQMLAGELHVMKKPDIDNVVKVYADALNHLAYHDDSQVVSITCEKYYSEEPRVEVILSDAEEEL